MKELISSLKRTEQVMILHYYKPNGTHCALMIRELYIIRRLMGSNSPLHLISFGWRCDKDGVSTVCRPS